MFCSVVKHLGSGRALKKWGKTLDCVSCFPLHFFRALPLPACFTTEQNTVEASLFVDWQILRRESLLIYFFLLARSAESREKKASGRDRWEPHFHAISF